MAKATKVDTKSFKKAPYNPRSMAARAKQALKESLKQFEDISGIVVNSRTGNILAGNHRWEQLSNMHGEPNLTVQKLGDTEFHQIMAGDDFTGFLMRIVDWPEEKEMAANVAANSGLLAGEFTAGLQEVLSEVQDYLADGFEGLRFDELSIDFGDLSSIGAQGIRDPDEVSEKIRQNAEEENVMLDTQDPSKQHGDVKIITSSIKIVVPGDIMTMVKEDLIEFLAERPYYDKLEIH